MLKDLEMSVYPSYRDEECTIIFSFHFRNEQKKLGEAVIYTGAVDFIEAQKQGRSISSLIMDEKGQLETVAWLKQFAIVEEYKNESIEKINEFIKMLGINKFILSEESPKQTIRKIGQQIISSGVTLRKQPKPILFG